MPNIIEQLRAMTDPRAQQVASLYDAAQATRPAGQQGGWVYDPSTGTGQSMRDYNTSFLAGGSRANNGQYMPNGMPQSPLMNAISPSIPSPTTSLPISLSSPMSQLNAGQQNRIGQSMNDMALINQARARTSANQMAGPANAQLQQGYNSLNANNSLQNLVGGMNFSNQMQGMQINQQQNNSALLQQLLGPMMGTMMQQGGFPGNGMMF